jgi:hypothetical protein
LVDVSSTEKVINPEELFLTDELTKTRMRPAQKKVAQEELTEDQTSARGTKLQAQQEDRSLVHLDFAKVVAGLISGIRRAGMPRQVGSRGITDTRPFFISTTCLHACSALIHTKQRRTP